MAKKEKFYELKTIKVNGAIHHLIKLEKDGPFKYHSWDGPSIVPTDKGCTQKKEYYLYGIKYSADEYQERLNNREGLPFYKQAGGGEERV